MTDFEDRCPRCEALWPGDDIDVCPQCGWTDVDPMSEAAPESVLNGLFRGDVDDLDEEGLSYVERCLRQVAFNGEIVPPAKVTPADADASVCDDALVRIVDIEPETRARAITFRGRTSGRGHTGDRPFFSIPRSEDEE